MLGGKLLNWLKFGIRSNWAVEQALKTRMLKKTGISIL